MIRKYDNRGAWYDAAKSDNEAVVGIADDDGKVYGRSIMIEVTDPKVGDILFIDGGGAKHYIMCDTYVASKKPAGWTAVGVVGFRWGNKAGIVHKENKPLEWSKLYSWEMSPTSGTIASKCDGATAISGTISTPANAAAGSTKTDYSFSIVASSLGDFVDKMNAWMTGGSFAPGVNDHWWCEANDNGNVTIWIEYVLYQQYNYTTFSNGIKMAHNFAPYSVADANMLRVNGATSGWGTISCKAKALQYFETNTANDPTTAITDTKRTIPVSLTYYNGSLGSYLRSVYGDGKEGWMKYMDSHELALGNERYSCKIIDGIEETQKLLGKTFVDKDGATQEVHPAAEYVNTIGYASAGLEAGKWHMPTIHELRDVVHEVTMGCGDNNRKHADPLNRSLTAIGGSVVNGASIFWSCVRCFAGYAWLSYGNNGCFHYGYFCYKLYMLPLALIEV